MAIFRRTLRILASLVAVLVAAGIGAALVLTETQRGRDNLAGIISSLASSGNRKVTVAGLDGIWSGRLSVDHVVLEDASGPWLVLRQVAVDWSPSALLSGTFRADLVSAGRIELARLPQATETSGQNGGATSLPVSVDIKRIDLPQIALGKDLAGAGIAELAARGSLMADASPLALDARLGIARSDGVQGSVDGTVHFAPADNRLDLDLKASEPAGGIIANLLKLPDAPPVDIAVSGKGPIDDWSGSGTFAVGGQVVTQLSGRHRLTDKGHRIEAKGDGAFERFLPEALKPLLTGRASFDFTGTATKAGGIDIEHASIDSDAVSGTASGSADPAGASDLSVDLAAKGAPVVLSVPTGGAPITLAMKTLTARAFGDGRAPAVDIGGSFVSVVTGGTEVRDLAAQIHSDGFDIENRSGPLRISLAAGSLKTDVATLAPLVAGQVKVDLAGSLGKDQIVLDQGTLTSDSFNASVTAAVNLADLSMTLKMNADAASSALPPQISTVLGPRVQFSATATRDPKGAFAANAISLKSGALTASGTASASGTDIQADLKGSLGDVSVLSPLVGVPVGGAVDFALTANGARTAPDFSVTASSAGLTSSGHAVSDVKLSASGKADIAEPAADVSLTGVVDGEPLDLKAALATADGNRVIRGIALSLGGGSLSGDLALGDDFLPSGTLMLDVPDLGPLASLAGQQVAGDLKGVIRLAAQDGVGSVAVAASSASIARGDAAARQITVDATVGNYLKAPAASGTIKAASLAFGSTTATDLDVDLKQDGAWTAFTGGATIAGVPATLAGRAGFGGGKTTIELASGKATVRGIEAAIAQPSTIIIADGTAGIDTLALDVGGGSVTVAGNAGAALDLTVKVAALPAALTNGFVSGLDAAGVLNGTAHVTGPAADPSVRFDAALQGAETSQTRKAGLGAFDLKAGGSYSAASGVTLDSATLSGKNLTGTASGTINPKGASDFSVDLSAAGPGLPLSLGSAASPIDLAVRSLSLKAAGAAGAARLDLSAILPSVATHDAKVNGLAVALHSDAFDIDRRSGPFAVTVTDDGVDLTNPAAAPLAAGKITAKATGSLSADTLVLDSGSVSGDALNGAFDGRVSLADGSIALALKADAASAALPAAARPVLGERVALSAALKRDADGNVSANGVTLNSGALSAQGDVSLAAGKLSAAIKGALADVSPLSKDASGALSFAASAEGEAAAPDLSLTVASDRLTVAQREITGLKLTARGKADAANPAANVALSGTVAGQPLQGSAVLRTTAGRRTIDDLLLSLGPNRISGNLDLDEVFVPVGSIKLDLPDIGPLAALALQKAEGELHGAIDFARNGGKPQLSVDATTKGISSGTVTVKDVSIRALIADYLAAPVISGTVKAGSVVAGGTPIAGIDVDLKRDGEWTAFSGGATVKNIPAKATGRVKMASGATTIELASAQATVEGIKAAVSQTSTITIAGGTTRLDGLVLDLGSGSAKISGAVGEQLALDVALSQVPLSIANSFSPGLDAAGAVSGTAKITGAPASPAVSFTVNGSGVATAQTRSAGFGAIGVTSTGSFAGNKLSFDAAISEGSGLALKGGGTVTTAGTPNLSLDFSGAVPFGFLAQKLAAQGLSLTGTANVALQVRGAANAPAISGTVRSSGARLLDAHSGIAVNDIAVDVSIGGGVARINRLTGTLSTRGTLSASGTVGIDPAQGFPADLAIKITDGRYTDGRVVTANLGGTLTVKGPLVSAPVIAGRIELGRTVITVPSKLPASLAELDVKHRNAPAAVLAQDRALNPPATGGSGGSGLVLDLTIHAPSQIFVQGRGVDAELGGSLKLTGPASSPQAVGHFTLKRGRLTVLSRRLNFTEGTLTFAGSLVPYLDLTAQSTTSDATVTIVVSGEATNPKFTFSSVPALPQDEVMAQLIFGQAMSKLSPLQIAQLAEAASQLAGIGGSTSLLENLRNAIGIDDLDVTTDATGGTAVSAGKYLNDRTYVTIQKGEKPGSGKATIDLNVGRGVKLRGEANDAGEAKGGVFYEREY